MASHGDIKNAERRNYFFSDVVIGQRNTAARQQLVVNNILASKPQVLSLVSCMVNSHTSKFAMTVTAKISRTRLIRRIPSILES